MPEPSLSEFSMFPKPRKELTEQQKQQQMLRNKLEDVERSVASCPEIRISLWNTAFKEAAEHDETPRTTKYDPLRREFKFTPYYHRPILSEGLLNLRVALGDMFLKDHLNTSLRQALSQLMEKAERVKPGNPVTEFIEILKNTLILGDLTLVIFNKNKFIAFNTLKNPELQKLSSDLHDVILAHDHNLTIPCEIFSVEDRVLYSKRTLTTSTKNNTESLEEIIKKALEENNSDSDLNWLNSSKVRESERERERNMTPFQTNLTPF